MSSGFGFKGAEGRCFRFWRELEDCGRDSAIPGACADQVEDYLECLHHKKAYARQAAINVQRENNAAKAEEGGDGGH